MKLSQERLRPFTFPLVSFTGDRIVLKGIIKLIVVVGTYPVFLCSPPTYEDSWYFSRINHQSGWAFWVQIICSLSSISEISKWNATKILHFANLSFWMNKIFILCRKHQGERITSRHWPLGGAASSNLCMLYITAIMLIPYFATRI